MGIKHPASTVRSIKDRQDSAAALVEARSKRTDAQQLEHLDKLFGKGQGAVKERAKLKARIAEAKKPAKPKQAAKKKAKVEETEK